MNQMDELEIDYKSIRSLRYGRTNKTNQVTKNELFTVLYEAIVEPKESRNEEQKKIVELLSERGVDVFQID